MKPTRFDHDNALSACWNIKEKGKESEMDTELVILNQVAGAFACNDSDMCAHISAGEFKRALDKANSA